MIKDVFTVTARQRDLHPAKELWVGESYVDRQAKIIASIVEENGAEPHANMKFIREVTFTIKKSTTMDQLKELAVAIREKCVIDCFQISINRQQNVAHMLFDWYDYKNHQCFYLYEAYQMAMSAMIVRKLRLNFPKRLEDKWLRYFLTVEYNEDVEVYQQLLEELKHKHLSKRQYALVQQMTKYVENVCKGTSR